MNHKERVHAIADVMLKLYEELRSEVKKACDWKEHGDWRDNLIMCPSQCYKNISYEGKEYVIYLRWRHSDPWQATLIETEPNGQFNTWSGDENQTKWNDLDVAHYSHDELQQIKDEAEHQARMFLLGVA